MKKKKIQKIEKNNMQNETKKKEIFLFDCELLCKYHMRVPDNCY